jgi:hypothetical protein
MDPLWDIDAGSVMPIVDWVKSKAWRAITPLQFYDRKMSKSPKICSPQKPNNSHFGKHWAG